MFGSCNIKVAYERRERNGRGSCIADGGAGNDISGEGTSMMIFESAVLLEHLYEADGVIGALVISISPTAPSIFGTPTAVIPTMRY